MQANGHREHIFAGVSQKRAAAFVVRQAATLSRDAMCDVAAPRRTRREEELTKAASEFQGSYTSHPPSV